VLVKKFSFIGDRVLSNLERAIACCEVKRKAAIFAR
jgi:hypothetical protein